MGQHPGFPCRHCAVGDHDKCHGFVGSMTDHPDSLPLCICRDCQPDRYRRLTHPEETR